jgi:hypothetical protein
LTHIVESVVTKLLISRVALTQASAKTFACNNTPLGITLAQAFTKQGGKQCHSFTATSYDKTKKWPNRS